MVVYFISKNQLIRNVKEYIYINVKQYIIMVLEHNVNVKIQGQELEFGKTEKNWAGTVSSTEASKTVAY